MQLPINFSICGTKSVAALLQTYLAGYNDMFPKSLSVNVDNIEWDESKRTLTQIALQNSGDGVANVPFALVSSLVEMQALRPFTSAEFNSLGGPTAFLKGALDSTNNRLIDNQVWGIPWMVDPRGFVYWRDMLSEAGVDEQTAFQSLENFEAALQQLQQAGYSSPLEIPVHSLFAAGQASCTWIWGAGVDFLSVDQHSNLASPVFLEALQSYFRLSPYLNLKNNKLRHLQKSPMCHLLRNQPDAFE
jgi:ABC-type glycerol-3-phosphate transport system substrate-binding protein